MTPTNPRWEGTATALSSVVHSAEALGTITYLRRERFLTPAGEVEEIPVISGNALRGLLRDAAADLWWTQIGRPTLPVAAMHAIWSGGALAKAVSSPLTGSRLAQVKQVCPVIGLFGTAGGGRIISGNAQIGKLVPICKETARIIPKKYHTDAIETSMWDLTQIESYTKVPTRRENVTGPTDDTIPPAIYGVESFLAGTQFYLWAALSWPAEAEYNLFQETLASWLPGAFIGGGSRAGHGRLEMRLDGPEMPQADVRDTTDNTLTEERILEVLSWLD